MSAVRFAPPAAAHRMLRNKFLVGVVTLNGVERPADTNR